MKTTKELARELGLIRKRSSTAGTSGSKKIFKTNQIFKYLIVIDYESTCWKDSKCRTQEIIEFPAVLLNTSTGKVESEFQFYVQPQECPILSDFCKELTGISQDQVDEGIPLPLCLAKFTRWLRQISQEKGLEFNTTNEETKNSCTFVTWSDWDLGVCLLYECRRKQLRKPVELNSWIDLRATYRTFYQRKPQGLNGALQDLGITFQGREHSGLDDAKNTARLAWRMMSDGCVMQITKTLAGPAKSKIGQRFTSLRPTTEGITGNGAVPNGRPNGTMVAPTTTTPTSSGMTTGQGLSSVKRMCSGEKTKGVFDSMGNDVKSAENIMPSSIVTKRLKSSFNSGTPTVQRTTSVAEAIPSTADTKCVVGHTITVTRNEFTPLNRDSAITRPNLWAEKPTNSAGQFHPNKQSNFSTSVLQRKGVTDITNIKQNAPKTPNNGFSLSDKPDSRGSGWTVRNSVQPQTPIFDSDITDDGLDCSLMSSGVECGRNTSGMDKPVVKDSSAGTSFRTPSLPPKASGAGTTMMKRTPPMCKCGRRANRKVVQSPGPNMGRPFFCCPTGRVRNSGGKSGCGFFKWENLHVHASPTLHTPSINRIFSVNNNSFVNNGSILVPPCWDKSKTSPASHLAAIGQPKFDSPGQ